MCDFAASLTAWMDGELAAADAIGIERHVQTCCECRDLLQTYRHVSREVAAYLVAYGDAVMTPRRSLRRPDIIGISTAAAIAAVLLLWASHGIQRSSRIVAPIRSAAAVPQLHASPRTADAAPGAAPTVHSLRRNRRAEADNMVPHVTGARRQANAELALGPAVEIAIPADAIFPPGAIPADVAFTADITIAPDGSVQQVRLQPELAVFERRSTQP